MKTFAAKYVLVDGEFRGDHAVTVGSDGRIASVGPVAVGSRIEHLGEVALIPGAVNAHSHAFQRAIRGRTEHVDPSRPDENFWTWRQQMYAALDTFGPDEIYAVSRWAFVEMLLAGITTVGEFHYVHHAPDGSHYADANELAHRVVAAARDAGIRVALLRVGYRRGGFEQPMAHGQHRFIDASDDEIVRRIDDLRSHYAADSLVTIGVAPHSIRAVPADTLCAMREAATRWGLPLHIHANEQRREVDESLREYGRRPVEVFADLGLLGGDVTLVHGTHLSERELDLVAEHDVTICACPTTERNLGDGFLPASELVRRGVSITIGSDSQAHIDPWEEVRCIEYHERLRTERRNVLAGAAGAPTTAAVLWPVLADAGARALGVEAGSLEPGRWADFVALDLNHPALVGATAATLLTDVCLSMTPGAIRDVWVGGRQVVAGGRHARAEAAAESFRRLVAR